MKKEIESLKDILKQKENEKKEFEKYQKLNEQKIIKFEEEIAKLNKNIDDYQIQQNEQEKKEKQNQEEIEKLNLKNNELTKEIKDKEKDMMLKLDNLKQNNFGLQSQLEDTKKKLENELKIYYNKINDLKTAEINAKLEHKN